MSIMGRGVTKALTIRDEAANYCSALASTCPRFRRVLDQLELLAACAPAAAATGGSATHLEAAAAAGEEEEERSECGNGGAQGGACKDDAWGRQGRAAAAAVGELPGGVEDTVGWLRVLLQRYGAGEGGLPQALHTRTRVAQDMQRTGGVTSGGGGDGGEVVTEGHHVGANEAGSSKRPSGAGLRVPFCVHESKCLKCEHMSCFTCRIHHLDGLGGANATTTIATKCYY